MEPYGRRTKIKANLIDNHIPKTGNWWESELSSVEKGRARMKAKKEIKDSVTDFVQQTQVDATLN